MTRGGQSHRLRHYSFNMRLSIIWVLPENAAVPLGPLEKLRIQKKQLQKYGETETL